ncbi:glycosyltransferase family 2 protein [Marnyiella aurantia]|uniref:Glycosyltransferase family 2 protein n=1 Tax=Marnyiella aurantia TaxID=2758037 RepID=A0A7D7LRN2_9FLAO|nr:glycosyltransferase family 2 protein [Marnyiella aurantia]MBA5247438.1 glycosyltransferase family 2 protein [Marnyiella aurantia]QMS99194.1 glycosyltransferase family 2 protein [Marnyiella aurantia]
MENIVISVIVPVYKVEKYLHNCIKSVLNQSHSNLELILVNDGSPDGSRQICDEFAAKDRRIKVIHKENGGLSSARNAGLEVATGEYISFLDSDDFWHEDYLKIMLNLCLEHHADIAQCALTRGSASVFPADRHKEKTHTFDNHSIFLQGAANIIVCAKLYRNHVIGDLRMPEGLINEDDFTTWKFYFKADKIAVTSRPLYYYTINDSSIMATQGKKPNLNFIEAYKERIEFFQDTMHKDLEDCSRAHLCKSMLLSSINSNLTEDQKFTVQQTFTANWNKVKASPYVPLNLKVLFSMYSVTPDITRSLVKKLYKA